MNVQLAVIPDCQQSLISTSSLRADVVSDRSCHLQELERRLVVVNSERQLPDLSIFSRDHEQFFFCSKVALQF